MTFLNFLFIICLEAIDGPVNIVQEDGTIFEGYYEKQIPHGYFRHINCFGDLEFLGCFSHGTLISVCWKSLPGGSFLISKDLGFRDDAVIFL